MRECGAVSPARAAGPRIVLGNAAPITLELAVFALSGGLACYAGLTARTGLAARTALARSAKSAGSAHSSSRVRRTAGHPATSGAGAGSAVFRAASGRLAGRSGSSPGSRDSASGGPPSAVKDGSVDSSSGAQWPLLSPVPSGQLTVVQPTTPTANTTTTESLNILCTTPLAFAVYQRGPKEAMLRESQASHGARAYPRLPPTATSTQAQLSPARHRHTTSPSKRLARTASFHGSP